MFLEWLLAFVTSFIRFILNLSIIYLRRLENILGGGVFYTLISVCASVCFSKQIQNLQVHTIVEFDYCFMITKSMLLKVEIKGGGIVVN